MIDDLLLALVLMAQATTATPSPPVQVQLDPICVYDEPTAIYDTHCVYQ